MQGDGVYVGFLHLSGFDLLVKWPMGMGDGKDLRPLLFRELIFLSQMQWQRHAQSLMAGGTWQPMRRLTFSASTQALFML